MPFDVTQGDCLEVMSFLQDKSVDMIFTDPPYGHTENGSLQQRREAALGWCDGNGVYRDGERAYEPIIANDGPEANDLFRSFLKEAVRLLKPGACLCCCCGGGGGPDPQFSRWSLWMDEVLEFKQMIVWDKGKIGMGWHYRRSYETILVGMKKGAKCNWYDDSHKIENIIRPGDYGIKKIIPSARQHPTEKPVALAEHFIKLHSKPGDFILDPFMGTGATGVAAVSLGREFIGIELNQEYVETARKRLEEINAATV